MVNLVNSVTFPLVMANSRMSAADVAVGVYESAKARGDFGVMNTASTYATSEIKDAGNYASRMDDKVKKALEAAHEEEAKEAKKARIKEEEEKKALEKGEDPGAAALARDSADPSNCAETPAHAESSPPGAPLPSMPPDSGVAAGTAAVAAMEIGRTIDLTV